MSIQEGNNLNEAIELPSSKKYKKVEEKSYKKWLNEHRDEIMAQPIKTRTGYAWEHINADLNLDLKYNAVYQLLYRNKMLHHDDNTCEENVDYYIKVLIEHLKSKNSLKKTKDCINKLIDLAATQETSKQATKTMAKRNFTIRTSQTDN